MSVVANAHWSHRWVTPGNGKTGRIRSEEQSDGLGWIYWRKLKILWQNILGEVPLNTLCDNRMGRVRRVKSDTGVTSRIRRGHAGWGGGGRLRAHGVLLFGGLRKLGTAFRAGGLPTSKGMRHLLRQNRQTLLESSMDLLHALVITDKIVHIGWVQASVVPLSLVLWCVCLCRWYQGVPVWMCIINWMMPPPILAVNHPFCILNSCNGTVWQLAQRRAGSARGWIGASKGILTRLEIGTISFTLVHILHFIFLCLPNSTFFFVLKLPR